MDEDQKEYSREELYQLVWSEPLVRVAARFGISDVAVGKMCRRYKIPLPGRGYWRRIETGRTGRRTPLPEVAPPHTPAVLLVTASDAAAARDRQEAPAASAQIAFEGQPANRILVDGEGPPRHPLAKATLRELRASHVDDYGATKCRASALFYLRVSTGLIPRATRIMDALYRAFDARGFEVRGGPEGGHAHVLVDGELIGFSIEERIRQVPHVLTENEKRDKARGYLWAHKYDHVASGLLVLKLDTGWNSGLRGQWSDTTRQRVEDCLNDLMVTMVRVVQHQREDRRKREEQHRQWEEEAARREALRLKREEEAAAVRQVFADAENWAKAERLRRFIAEVERRGTGRAPDPRFTSVADWVVWASDQANHLDPLSESAKAMPQVAAP